MEYKFDDMTEYFIISDLHGNGEVYDSIINKSSIKKQYTPKNWIFFGV